MAHREIPAYTFKPEPMGRGGKIFLFILIVAANIPLVIFVYQALAGRELTPSVAVSFALDVVIIFSYIIMNLSELRIYRGKVGFKFLLREKFIPMNDIEFVDTAERVIVRSGSSGDSRRVLSTSIPKVIP